MDDGLPSNAVTGVAQGRDGYLWLTTYAGLVRFDGVRFVTFTSETAAALPSDRLLGFAPARDGALWILTEQLAIVRFDPATGSLERFGAGLAGTRTVAVAEDASGTTWALTDAGLFRRQGRRFVAAGEGLAGWPAVFASRHDRAGGLWLGTERRGVVRFRQGRRQGFTAADGLPATRLNLLSVDAGGAVWAGTVRPDGAPGALARFDGRRFVQTTVSPGRAGPWLWAGPHVLLGGRPVYTAGSQIHALTADREGSRWAATNSDGLVRLRPALFQVYSEPEGLPDRHVYSVVEDRSGGVWVGMPGGGGLSRLGGGTVETLPPSGLPSRVVHTVYQDRAGRVWLGYNDGQGGACRFDGERCRPVPGLALPAVYAILQGPDGAFWFAAGRRLCRWREGQAGPPRCLTAEQGLPDAHIRTLRQTPDGTLWAGTENGLARIRQARGGGLAVRVLTTADGLSGNAIRSLHLSPDGVLWVGTGGRGLSRVTGLSGERPRAAAIRARDGLPDDVVYALVEDGHGRLWMSTNRGIGWARLADLDAFADGRASHVYATLYTEADGLRNREGNGSQQAAIRTRDGRLWFATQDGVAVVDPAAVSQGGRSLPVRVETVTSGTAAWDARGPVRVGASQRQFEVAYTALTFVAPERVQFRYRLEGLDPGWVEAGTRRTAFYSSVPPGRYTFRVAARHPSGRWAEAAPLAVRVAPFWYETTAARLAAALLLAALVAGGVRQRVRRLHRRAAALERDVATRTADLVASNALVSRQAEQLREMDAAKNRLFANLSHEFRTPLTLILGPLESGREGAYGPLPAPVRRRDALMLRNGRRLLRLVNQVLDLATLEAGHLVLDVRPHDLPGFLRATTLAFVPLAERQGIALTVDVGAAPPVAAFDREQMERVVSNLLSNALKFTDPGGAVRVACRQPRPATVDVVVEDTGLGIAPEHAAHVFDRFFQVDASSTRAYEGSGIGLALVKELVELHGGSVWVESTPDGSRFVVRLPLPETLPSGVPVRAPAEASGEPFFYGLEDDAEPGDAEPHDAEVDRTTVLVVDDNADLRAYLRHVLSADYRVVEAADGAEALDRTRDALPDLVVADVMMPRMDGLAFCRALRDDPATDCIPVVLLTARSDGADEVAGLATGADDYVTKPFTPEVLRARVGNLIAMRRRLRDRLQAGHAAVPDARPEAASGAEPAFTARVRQAVLAHLADDAFTVEALAAEVALSYSQLHRRLTAESGQRPQAFIRAVRLDAGARLLADGEGTVSEVAYAVGFQSLAHFSRAFRAQFGVAPSAYARSLRDGAG